jgi:hypothetical protein
MHESSAIQQSLRSGCGNRRTPPTSCNLSKAQTRKACKGRRRGSQATRTIGHHVQQSHRTYCTTYPQMLLKPDSCNDRYHLLSNTDTTNEQTTTTNLITTANLHICVYTCIFLVPPPLLHAHVLKSHRRQSGNHHKRALARTEKRRTTKTTTTRTSSASDNQATSKLAIAAPTRNQRRPDCRCILTHLTLVHCISHCSSHNFLTKATAHADLLWHVQRP